MHGPSAVLQVFLSSQMRRDVLSEERVVARRAIEATEVSRCWSWEQYGVAGPFPPMDLCLDEVKRSDALVLVLGRELTDNTRAEYELAEELGLPRAVFVKDGRRSRSAREFLEHIRSGVTYEEFRNPGELEAMVRRSLLMNMARALRSQRGRPIIASSAPAARGPFVPKRAAG